jgi:membrane-associated phospholipid phosphatase
LTYSLSSRLSLLFLVLAVLELTLLPSLLPFDGAFSRWLDTQRSCGLDYVVFIVKDRPLLLLETLGVLALIVLCRQGRWQEARHSLVAVVSGGFFCELLKTVMERPRPSVLPEVVAGNSFPSGHMTTALLVAGALGFLWLQEKSSNWRKATSVGILSILVSLTAGQRLYLGVHWLTDIVGSLFIVGAWLCLTLPRPRLFTPTRQLVGWLGFLLTVYFCFYLFPTLRLALPSALTISEDPVFVVSFGENKAPEQFQGAWGDNSKEPAGPITWLTRGEASVDIFFPEQRAYLLKIAMRPLLQSKAFACFPLEIAVNQQRLDSLLLYRGWREYTLSLDAHWMKPGVNTITFRTGAAFPEYASDQRTVAFRHIRVFEEKK